MSREPYCPMCGVVESIHSGVYCSRLSRSEALNATLRETIHTLRAELEEARAKEGKLREQRDRLLKAACGLADGDDEKWDCRIESIRELEDEISKEKEAE
jgi:predicted RNase H-like nuclease (RuvC/YqgF family)